MPIAISANFFRFKLVINLKTAKDIGHDYAWVFHSDGKRYFALQLQPFASLFRNWGQIFIKISRQSSILGGN
jgi:hypothetical protein